MADKRSLGFFGFVLGVVTGAVMLAAAVTVQAQIAAGPNAQATVASALPPR
jgi:hypothetical protein